MKVLYDHQIFEMQRFGGISRYFCELFNGLEKNNEIEVDLSVTYATNEYLKGTRFSHRPKADPGSYDAFMGGREFRGKWNLYTLRNRFLKTLNAKDANRLASIKALKRQDFDVFHPTYYDDYFLPYIGKKKFVLTVYDMIHELYPEYFNLAELTADRKRRLAEEAHKIIAISECTKRDLIDFYGIDAAKIEVVYLANSLNSQTVSLPVSLKLPVRYVLFVGARAGYKNFYFFVHAMRGLLARDPTLHIVCTGAEFTKNELAFLKIHRLSERVGHRAVSDTALENLYAHALVFVFPSLYEGFGLPILEAFSNHCPVVLGRAGSLPEIGGDGALYFEPKDAKSLQEVMADVLYNPARRAELVERGNVRLSLYSWGRTCKETGALYRRLLA